MTSYDRIYSLLVEETWRQKETERASKKYKLQQTLASIKDKQKVAKSFMGRYKPDPMHGIQRTSKDPSDTHKPVRFMWRKHPKYPTKPYHGEKMPGVPTDAKPGGSFTDVGDYRGVKKYAEDPAWNPRASYYGGRLAAKRIDVESGIRRLRPRKPKK
jgi:hypothetical protein